MTKWRVLLVLVVASLIIPPLTGSALGGSQLPQPSVAAGSLAQRQDEPDEEDYLPNCVRFTVDLTSGVKLPDPGTYDMVFQIYSSPRRGRSLWKEPHEDVEIQRDGSFSVLLGCAGSPLRPEFWSGGPLWVEVQVVIEKPEPLRPRIPLSRVPYAYHAIQADEAEHAQDADHADEADHADDADHADEADTALYADEAHHADTADSADEAGYAKSAATAEEAGHAKSADTAEEAEHAETADFADVAGTAEEALHAQGADVAKEAGYARTAGRAENADYADEAGSALTASWATRAGNAADLDCSGCVDEDELSFDPVTQEELEAGFKAFTPDDLVCTACVDESELSFDPLTQEEFDQAPSPDDLVCTACVDESELSFVPLTPEELDQALRDYTPDDLACVGCVKKSELSFDPATQAEMEEAFLAYTPGDLVCTACVDEAELSFDPLTQEEFDNAESRDDLVCTACVDESELSFVPLTLDVLEEAFAAYTPEDLTCTACVDESELSFVPLTREELEEELMAYTPDDLECKDCVDEDELSFDPLTQEEFDSAPSPDDLACAGCVDEDELSFDPLTQEEFDQAEIQAALDGFQLTASCSPTVKTCVVPLEGVPADKIFIIEHVSAWVMTEPDYDPGVSLAVMADFTPGVEHFIDLEHVSGQQPDADKQFWVANHPVLAYADSENLPDVVCRVGADGACSVTVSGRLVEAAEAGKPFQSTLQVAGSKHFIRGAVLTIPDGYVAVIQHMSARVWLADASDIVHTLGIRVLTDPDTLPLEPEPSPVPDLPRIFFPVPEPGEPEAPDDPDPLIPEPLAGAHIYLLTPSLPPASSLLSYRTASEAILAYVMEGQSVEGICAHTLPPDENTMMVDVECTITISGYLVELPASP